MADTLHNYPVEWIDRWQLAHGQRVTVRPVLPQDLLLEHNFVAHGMTARSRYQRFQVGLRELPEGVAHYLTEIDYERHFALVVERSVAAGRVLIADGRFVRDPQRPRVSEFALAVADDWQGLGLGRRLLQTLLAAARVQGLDMLYGDALRDNAPMLALTRSMGFARQTHPDDARLVRVHRAPSNPATDVPSGPPVARGQMPAVEPHWHRGLP
jgi:acetyltransferase